jgi:hypothetical protein
MRRPVMKRRLRPPSPALVISTIALFVALAGGAAAASGLISGQKIIPHSIAENRLTPRAIEALTKPSALSHAYIAAGDFKAATPLPVDQRWVTLKSLALPGGYYVIFAKSQIRTGSTPDAACSLEYDDPDIGTIIDEAFLGAGAQASAGSDTLSLTTTLQNPYRPFKLRLACRSWQPNAAAYDANIVAIKVGSVTRK